MFEAREKKKALTKPISIEAIAPTNFIDIREEFLTEIQQYHLSQLNDKM